MLFAMRWRVLVFLSLLITAACQRERRPAGKELARLNNVPEGIQRSGAFLIVQTQDATDFIDLDKTVETGGVHSFLLRIPVSGGPPTEIARLPNGEFRVSGDEIAFAGQGSLLLVKPTGGVRKLADVGDAFVGPVWVDGGVLGIAHSFSEPCCKVVRVSRSDGTVSAVGKLSESHTAHVATDRDGSFIVDRLDGKTAAVSRAGDLQSVTSPPGFILCFAMTQTHLWWGQSAEDEVEVEGKHKFVWWAAARSGGTPQRMHEFRAAKGVSCGATANVLYYSAGSRIFALAHGGTPRVVVDSHKQIYDLLVDGDALYWTEFIDGHQWSLRTAPLR